MALPWWTRRTYADGIMAELRGQVAGLQNEFGEDTEPDDFARGMAPEMQFGPSRTVDTGQDVIDLAKMRDELQAARGGG